MIEVSFINPLRFKKQGYSSNYNTKWFDEFLFGETIKAPEEPKEYFQPFNLDDPLVLQITSPEVAVDLHFIRISDGITIHSAPFTPISSAVIDSVAHYTYQINVDLNTVGVGTFYCLIIGGTTTLQSNNICIDTNHDQTIQLKYRNSKFYQEVIWEKDPGFYMYLRVQGFIRHKLPERISNTYQDQPVNTTMLKTVPYNSWTFITNPAGIPTYMIDLLNRISGCNTTYWDGRLFTVPDSAKWEEKEEDFYPMRGWGIDLLETKVKSKIAFDGAGEGPGVITPAVKKELFSDWWETTPGSTEVTGLSNQWGYNINEIYEVLELVRSGLQQDEVSGTPGNRQMKWDSVAHKFITDSNVPFEVGETVFCLFKKI